VPRDEQFDAIAQMQKAGLIRHAGLSNVSVEEIDAAAAHFVVASVQNRYHVIDRRHEAVVEHCEKRGIPFIAYFPLATGARAGDSRYGASSATTRAGMADQASTACFERSRTSSGLARRTSSSEIFG